MTLAFNYSLAADYLRVSVDGTTVFETRGAAVNRNGGWAAAIDDSRVIRS